MASVFLHRPLPSLSSSNHISNVLISFSFGCFFFRCSYKYFKLSAKCLKRKHYICLLLATLPRQTAAKNDNRTSKNWSQTSNEWINSFVPLSCRIICIACNPAREFQGNNKKIVLFFGGRGRRCPFLHHKSRPFQANKTSISLLFMGYSFPLCFLTHSLCYMDCCPFAVA